MRYECEVLLFSCSCTVCMSTRSLLWCNIIANNASLLQWKKYTLQSKSFHSKCMTFTQTQSTVKYSVFSTAQGSTFSNEQSSWAYTQYMNVWLSACCLKRDIRGSMRKIKVESEGFNECWHLCAMCIVFIKAATLIETFFSLLLSSYSFFSVEQ